MYVEIWSGAQETETGSERTEDYSCDSYESLSTFLIAERIQYCVSVPCRVSVMLENIVNNNWTDDPLLLIVRRSSPVAFDENASTSENASDWQSICLHRPANVTALLSASPLLRGARCSNVSTLPASLIGTRLYLIMARIQFRAIVNRAHRQTLLHSLTVYRY